MVKELSNQEIEILSLLQKNGSLASQEIADRLHISQSPCWRKINNLRDTGVIKKNVALLDQQKLGLNLIVFITINLSALGRNQLLEFEKEVGKFPEVLECYTMTGAWDYMLKAVAKDIYHFEHFLREKLMALESIGECHSHIAVTEIKNTTELPLGEF
ncbi:MAG: Lrp/AsnC family transcriptional regulator [Cellvibrionaceae bacterium]|nr:Lrp/AsnC family transcriptional regulator [Cellvibrionaceae bacterium]